MEVIQYTDIDLAKELGDILVNIMLNREDIIPPTLSEFMLNPKSDLLSAYKFSCTMNNAGIEQYWEILGINKLSCDECNVYEHDIDTLEFTLKHEIPDNEGTTIFEHDNKLIATLPTAGALLALSDRFRYTFINIITSDKLLNDYKGTLVAHATMLIFDNFHRQVYYFDSNTQSLQERYNFDMLFINYFQSISQVINYQYVMTEDWKIKKSLQFNSIHSFDYGNCQGWILFIAHWLHVCDDSPATVYKKIADMSEQTRSNLLYTYLRCMYDLLKN